jgi:choline dehydrogenase-like flavoprotein
MNPQSRGEITLNSANPADAPVIDPRFLSHPYDRCVAIEALRQLMLLFEAEVFRENTVKWIGSPESKADEDIWVSCFACAVSRHMARGRRRRGRRERMEKTNIT